MLGQQGPKLGLVLDEPLGAIAFVSLNESIAADRHATRGRRDGTDRPSGEMAFR